MTETESDPSPLLRERAGALLRLTIHRPRAANAIDGAVARGIVAGLAEAAADPQVRAVVLTGSGDRVFCAGRDLKNPEGLAADAFNRQRRDELQAYTEALLAFHKPLVVALNGAALGAGLMLALHADQVVAVEHASIALPEIDVGIAAFLGHALVAELAGNALANDLVLTGRRATAPEAQHHGLVHAIVASDRLAAESAARAEALGAKPAEVFREMKGWILQRRRAAVAAALQEHERSDAARAAAR
jgi:enoyl-CoA hydratase/carnithine racemase